MKVSKVAAILARNSLVIAKLGAGGDHFDFIPKELRPFTVLVCLDAAQAIAKAETTTFANLVYVREVVAAAPPPVTFIERAWWGCSSILPVDDMAIRKFGLERLVQEKARHRFVPTTLPRILAESDIIGLDFLITDLEGIDLTVIKSCEAFFARLALLQCGMRFATYYAGEPHFHDASKYLQGMVYQLVGLKPDYWKPVSSRMGDYSDGCIVWGDCLFFRPGADEDAGQQLIRLVRQVLLLVIAEKPSLAAHLLETSCALIDGELAEELSAFSKPRSAMRRWRNFISICLRQAQLKLSTTAWYRAVKNAVQPELHAF